MKRFVEYFGWFGSSIGLAVVKFADVSMHRLHNIGFHFYTSWSRPYNIPEYAHPVQIKKCLFCWNSKWRYVR